MSELEKLKASLKKKITSEIKGLLAEFLKQLLKLLKPRNEENEIEETEPVLENECRCFSTPTK